MEELKQWIKCLTDHHEWKEEGTEKDNKIVAFCKHCGKVITIEKRINEREVRANETNGEPYLDCINHTTGENIWFVPYYELVRKYAGETVTGNITTAKQIQAYNTMEALIKQYNQHKKLAQNNKNNTNTIARFRIVDDKGNVLYRWTNAK